MNEDKSNDRRYKAHKRRKSGTLERFKDRECRQIWTNHKGNKESTVFARITRHQQSRARLNSMQENQRHNQNEHARLWRRREKEKTKTRQRTRMRSGGSGGNEPQTSSSSSSWAWSPWQWPLNCLCCAVQGSSEASTFCSLDGQQIPTCTVPQHFRLCASSVSAAAFALQSRFFLSLCGFSDFSA